MLSIKQGGIKYDFLSLWYDPMWDWTPVSRTIGEHSYNSMALQNNIYPLKFTLILFKLTKKLNTKGAVA